MAGADGNRFDDPDALYRVLYASSQRLGCFLETLGRFRVDPRLPAELAEIEGEDDYCPLGEVPLEWVEKRVMGVATAGGEYAENRSGKCSQFFKRWLRLAEEGRSQAWFDRERAYANAFRVGAFC